MNKNNVTSMKALRSKVSAAHQPQSGSRTTVAFDVRQHGKISGDRNRSFVNQASTNADGQAPDNPYTPEEILEHDRQQATIYGDYSDNFDDSDHSDHSG